MNSSNSSIERLDLRFRASVPKRRKSWLPGGSWLWFFLGFTAGICGWNYGRDLLQQQLAEQVAPDRDPAEALLALEALNLLGEDREIALVRALAHPDARVVRSAMHKLNACIEGYMHRPGEVSSESIQLLIEQLSKAPRDLPNESRIAVSGLVARLYADCVRLEEPRLRASAQRCLDILKWLDGSPQQTFQEERLASADDTVIASPLATAESVRLADDPESTDGSDGGGYAILSSSSLPGTNLRVSSAVAASVVTAEASYGDVHAKGQRLSDSDAEPFEDSTSLSSINDIAQDSQQETMGSSTATNKGPTIQPAAHSRDLPVTVGTPASISSHPVVRMKLISDQPNLQGIEKAEIAELVRLLGSENPDISKAASLALSHKGFNDFEIELATELAIGSAAKRLELVQQIAVSDQVNPRPWLVWMAEDGQPEVRRMSISLLSSMLDEEVQRSLRILLFRESDPQIKDLMRKVLLNAKR